MNTLLNIKDRLDMLDTNFNSMVSLLHLVNEGMKAGSTGINENAEAVYAAYLLGKHLETELHEIIRCMDSL